MAAKGSAVWQPELQRTWSSTACNGGVTSIALSSKGKVAVSTKSSVYLFDPPPSLVLTKEISGPEAGITATAFSNKGTDVVSGGSDGFVKWWQVETGEEVCATQFPQAEGNSELAVQEVACSNAGFVAAVSGRYLCVFGAGGEHLHTLGAEGDHTKLQQLHWLTSSSVSACSGSEVTVWSVSQEQYQETGVFAANPSANITCLAASPDGRFIAAACENSMVQVWDTEQQESTMDPMLKISEGIEGKVERLSWDCTSKLLAAAVGNDVLVWDISAVKDGKVESYVCMGYDQGARVSCLAFQATGSLLASAADNGQCLVHDVNSFGSHGVVNGLISHVASTNVSSAESGDAVKALAWHPTGILLVGTDTGSVVALQMVKAPQQQQQRSSQGNGPAAAAQVQQQPQQQPQQQLQQQQPPQQQRYRNPDMRRQMSNGPGGPDIRPGGRSNRHQGWGGEPLITGSEASVDYMSHIGGGRGRGRSRENRMMGNAYTPFKRDVVPNAVAGSGGTGSVAAPAGATPPEADGSTAPQAGDNNTAAVMAAGWGMVHAVPGMGPMWVRPMAMPYAIPYGQMIPTAMGPMPAGMAAGMPAAPMTPGMTPYVPAPGMQPTPVATAPAAGRYPAGGSAPAGVASNTCSAGANMGPRTGSGRLSNRHNYSSSAGSAAGGSGGTQHMPNGSQASSASTAAAAAAALATPSAAGGSSSGMGATAERRSSIPGPAPPPGPAPAFAYERGPAAAATGAQQQQQQQQPRYSGSGDRNNQDASQRHNGGSYGGEGSNNNNNNNNNNNSSNNNIRFGSSGGLDRAASDTAAAGGGDAAAAGPGNRFGGGRGGPQRGYSASYGQAGAGGILGGMHNYDRANSGGGRSDRYQRSTSATSRDAYHGHYGMQGDMQQQQHMQLSRQGSSVGTTPQQQQQHYSRYSPHGGGPERTTSSSGSVYRQGSISSGVHQGSAGGAGGYAAAGPAAAADNSSAGGVIVPRSPTAAGLASPVPIAAMMPRPMAVQMPIWMYPQAAAHWSMAAYPQHAWAAAPYYPGYYPAAAAYPGMAQHAAMTPVAAAASSQPAPGAVMNGAAAAPAAGGAMASHPSTSSIQEADAAASSESNRQGGEEGAGDDSSRGGVQPPDAGAGAAAAASAADLLQGNRALYVGNLAPTVNEAALNMQFAMFGPVMQVQVMRDRETRQPRGFGFVTFVNSSSAQAAMAQLNGAIIMGPFQGRALRVSPSNKAR